MPATGIPAADIAQGALGLGEAVVGLINDKKTRNIAEQLQRERPQYNISPLVDENLALAKSDLAQGMSSAASKAYTDLDNSQFSSSLGALLKSGGGANDIGALYGNNQEGRLRLAQMKDQLRLNQIQNVLRTSENKQNEQQTAWQLNQFAPWEDRAQANANARLGSQQQIWEGLGTVGAAIGNYGQNQREQKQFNSIPTTDLWS